MKRERPLTAEVRGETLRKTQRKSGLATFVPQSVFDPCLIRGRFHFEKARFVRFDLHVFEFFRELFRLLSASHAGHTELASY